MKVAHFGTFDVDNYGDLLFPKIAEWRIPNVDWLHVSPIGVKPAFVDSVTPLCVNEICDYEIDAVIVGGGNILHFEKATIDAYKNISNYAYSSLWLGAARVAIKKNIPLIFNGPSISNLTKGYLERYIFNQVFKNSDYISLREEYSSRLFTKYPSNIIPDTVIDISRMWPKEDKIISEDYVVIHVNDRYVTNFKDTLSAIEKISKSLKAKIVLLPIGPCHGDLFLAKRLAQASSLDIHLETTLSLKSFAMLIANAKAYVGSSMHGYITAFSYDVPGLMVLNNSPLHKFTGLLDVVGIQKEVICVSWNDAVKQIESLYSSDINPATYFNRLDMHWDKIISIINDKNNIKEKASIKCCEYIIPIARVESKLKRFLNNYKNYP